MPMFDAKPSDDASELLARLQRQHRHLLKPGEVFLAACYASPAGEAPPHDPEGGRKPRLGLDSGHQELQAEALARHRFALVRSVLGIAETETSEFPRTHNGYLLTHTDRRMLVFDGSGDNYQVQSPMKGLWLQPIAHEDGTFTLVFSDGHDRIALTSHPLFSDLAEQFVKSFPDRRTQTRVIRLRDLRNDQQTVDF